MHCEQPENGFWSSKELIESSTRKYLLIKKHEKTWSSSKKWKWTMIFGIWTTIFDRASRAGERWACPCMNFSSLLFHFLRWGLMNSTNYTSLSMWNLEFLCEYENVHKLLRQMFVLKFGVNVITPMRGAPNMYTSTWSLLRRPETTILKAVSTTKRRRVNDQWRTRWKTVKLAMIKCKKVQ